MIVNLFVIFLILIVGNHYYRKKNRDSDSNRKRYIKVICFILILQSGLRNVAVGADTFSYYLSFKDSISRSWKDVYSIVLDYYKYNVGKDPGFPVFEKLCSTISESYQIFLIIIAVVFFTALGKFIHNNTTRLIDSIVAFVIYSVLFYSFFSITGHRQTLATAGTLFAFEFLKKKKFIPFLLIILLAATIHKSCLVFIPLYFLSYVKKIKFVSWIVLVSFPILLVSSSLIAKYIFIFLNSYEEYEHFDEYRPTTFVVLMLFIALLSLIKYEKIIVLDKRANNYYAGLTLAILFLSLVFEIHGYMRIVQYFSIFILLIIPLILSSFSAKSSQIRTFVYSITIIILLSFFIKANIGIEYKFFWQEMKLEKNYE